MTVKDIIKASVKEAVERAYSPDFSAEINVGLPKDFNHGDYSTNAALHLTKIIKKSPEEIAKNIVDKLSLSKDIIEKIEIAKPGFINFYLSKNHLCGIIDDIEKKGVNYGRSETGQNKRVQVEFVGSNPTGPLNIVSARAAAVGDCIASLLSALGYNVEREFYINDRGNQVNVLAESVEVRCRQSYGEKIDLPENGYAGEYINDIAKEVTEKEGKSLFNLPRKEVVEKLKEFSINKIIGWQKEVLHEFGVNFDVWFSENSLYNSGEIEQALKILENNKSIYELENAKWFKASAFGDEKDRVLIKADGDFTYLTADIAYHINKYKRGFDKIIGVLGPDHHGHILTMRSVLSSLKYPLQKFDFMIVQQVNLIERGEKVTMSKRAGKFITMKELIDEVGVDVTRYFFLMRSMSSHLDFDLDLAKKQSDENPVFYLQYAHARICSILEFVKKQNIKEIKEDLSLLKEKEEIEILRKLEIYPETIEVAALTYSPHLITRYLEELAGLFHRFYTEHRVVTENIELVNSRVKLIKAVKIVLSNGLSLLGVKSPDRM